MCNYHGNKLSLQLKGLEARSYHACVSIYTIYFENMGWNFIRLIKNTMLH